MGTRWIRRERSIVSDKLRLLDAFCGAGGAGMGYHRAGFEVVGVDIEPQPRYPFEFYQGDALEFIERHGAEFDVIHASPPCQAYTTLPGDFSHYPDLIDDTRKILKITEKPYVIENVPGSRKKLRHPVMLCGYVFGLKTYRHRYFETNPFFLVPPHIKHPERCPASGRGKSPQYGIISVTGNGGACNLGMPYLDYASKAMGIDWMTRAELSQAIPPVYTEWLGKRLLEAIRER